MSKREEDKIRDSFVEELVKKGYEEISIKNKKDLESNLIAQIKNHNKIEKLEDRHGKDIITHLQGGNALTKADKLRNGMSLTYQKEGGKEEQRNIEFINQQQWCKNIFQVAKEVSLGDIRFDVVLFINGLPLVIIELKKYSTHLGDAFQQIVDYQGKAIDLYDYAQLFIVSNGERTKYFSNNNELKPDFVFQWTDEKNIPLNDLIVDFTPQFLEPCHLAKMITKYMVIKNDGMMVLRPYQVHAIELGNRHTLESGNNGFIWHTTGSGKTLTSFKLSQLLKYNDKIDKVIFLVDRRDLDAQTVKEFSDFSNNDDITNVESSKHLVKLLKSSTSDDKLIISTIQKLGYLLNTDNSHNAIQELNELREKSIVFIIDECHRSQYGDMAKSIRNYFKKAKYIGFTGTPIFGENATKKGVTTHSFFDNMLHKYVIKNGIADRNVLGFSIDYVGQTRVEQEKTKYANYIPIEAIDMGKPDIEGELKDDGDYTFKEDPAELKADKRIEAIVEWIITHHNTKTLGRTFNAMLCVSGKDMVRKYYDYFKQIPNDLNVVALYSKDSKNIDDQSKNMEGLNGFITDYNTKFGTSYNMENYDNYSTAVQNAVKRKEVDIVIVSDMLLTGFDAKQLNTLYVDKYMVYHNLIQAFSRTNRVYSKKDYGQIVSFRDMRKAVKEALLLFADDNLDENGLLDVLSSVCKRHFSEVQEEMRQKLKQDIIIQSTKEHMERLREKTRNREISKEDVGFLKTLWKYLGELGKLKNEIKTHPESSTADVQEMIKQVEEFQAMYNPISKDIKEIIVEIGNDKSEEMTEEEKELKNEALYQMSYIERTIVDELYIINLLETHNKVGKIVDKEGFYAELEKYDELRPKKELFAEYVEVYYPTLTDADKKLDDRQILHEFFEKKRHEAMEIMANTYETDVAGIEAIWAEYQKRDYSMSEVVIETLEKHCLKEEDGFMVRKEKREQAKADIETLRKKYVLLLKEGRK